jgi:hypothetical protein
MSILSIPLPKNLGSVDIDTAKLTDELKERAMSHGFTQAIADIAAGAFVKSAMTRDAKPGDRVFDTTDELNAHLRERAAAKVASWYAGAWASAAGGRPRDPVLAEQFAILFARMGTPQKEWSKMRAEGIRATILAYAHLRTGKAVPKKNADAVFEKVFSETQAKAQAIVAARSTDGDFDISDLI